MTFEPEMPTVPPRGPMPEPRLDKPQCCPRRLEGLLRALGREACSEFCARVVSDLTQSEERLLAHDVQDGDPVELQQQAHILRGIAGTVGADDFQKTATLVLATASDSLHGPTARDAINLLLVYLRATRAEMAPHGAP